MVDDRREAKEKVGPREGARLLRETLAFVWRASPRLTATLGLLTLVAAGLPVAIAWTGKAIVDAVMAGSRDETVRWLLIELGLVAAHTAANRLLGLVREVMGLRLSREVNVAILEKAATLELEQFEDGRFYDRLTKVRRGASYRPVQVVHEGFQALQNALTLAGYVALITGYSPCAAVVLLAAALPSALVEMRFSRFQFQLHNWRSPAMRQLTYLEWVLANNQHAKEVKLFGLGDELLRRYRTLFDGFYDGDRRLATRRALAGLAVSFLATGAFYGCYATVAIAAATKVITLGAMTLYLVAFRQGQQAFQAILAAFSLIYEQLLYMSNLFDYLGAPPPAPPARAALPPPDAREQGIRFEKVGFRYATAPKEAAPGDGAAKEPAEERWALRDLSFFVPRGQSVALVGENGAGKTTIVKLLTRLYLPTEGRVLVDGKDVRDWDPDELRRRVAVVFQDWNEYELDVQENVGIGSLPHLGERPRIERAGAASGADEVVASLPGKWETRLGKYAHDGVELSGGQWQKIALARAFMREEADVLVLDEPTASLDAKAERAVFERFRALTRGKTTFLISHRFSSVRMVDRILVLEKGRLVEDGSHQELVAAGGRYAALFELQAEGYR
jgi:ATP-binding cassette, subfamily B, bacterial